MNNTELLKARYIVIADYPNSIYKVGAIIEKEGLQYLNTEHFDKFPNIFRKLDWWEHREEKDMLGYFIGMNKGFEYYIKVDNWRLGDVYPSCIVDGIEFYAPYCQPISESDYQNYINSKK